MGENRCVPFKAVPICLAIHARQRASVFSKRLPRINKLSQPVQACGYSTQQ